MDKAKAAITDFMSRSGHHDTTVHEAVAPAVTHEVVKPHMHEEVITAVDKEVHQDHYHRTVQPVLDREVLPEEHTTKIGSVQHREFDHRDHDHTKRNLLEEQALFRDERRVEAATASQSVAPTVGGEHVHHHIHETIQPVVQREVIQPTVVHTTVPIHEVHHNKATHHESTSLPAMTMDQFKAKGGALTGREERYDEFEGVPKGIGGGSTGGLGGVRGLEQKVEQKEERHREKKELRQGGYDDSTTGEGMTGRHGHHHHDRDRDVTGTSRTGGLTGSSTGGMGSRAEQDLYADRGREGQGNLTGSSTQGGVLGQGMHPNRGVGTDGVIGDNNSGLGNNSGYDRDTRDNTTGTEAKPSLLNRLNPMTDSTGDGKAGFMK